MSGGAGGAAGLYVGNGGAGGNASGGAVSNHGTSTFLNDTVAYNLARPGLGGVGQPSVDGAQGLIGSVGLSTGGGVDNNGSFRTGNSIIAANVAASGPDIAGSVTSDGHNLVGDAGDAVGLGTSDLKPALTATTPLDPLLTDLGNYGGPTQTMLLVPAGQFLVDQNGFFIASGPSPAIDAGDDSLALSLATDQRGLPRKYGAHIDIGAVEMQASNSFIFIL